MSVVANAILFNVNKAESKTDEYAYLFARSAVVHRLSMSFISCTMWSTADTPEWITQ